MVLAPTPDRPAGPEAGYSKGRERGHAPHRKDPAQSTGISRGNGRGIQRDRSFRFPTVCSMPWSGRGRHGICGYTIGIRPQWEGIKWYCTTADLMWSCICYLCFVCPFMSGPYHYHSLLCGLYAIQCRLHLVEAVSVHVDCVIFCVYALTLNVRVNDTYAV